MNAEQREKYLHTIFVWGIIIKGINAVLEIAGSLLFLFADKLLAWMQFLVQQEITEDPRDLVAHFFQHHFIDSALFNSKKFVFFYLLSHGVIKLFLVVGLLRNKLWAYPMAIIVFILFVIYQVYRYSFTHSLFLIFLTIFDIIIIWLTWHEYRYYKRQSL